MKLSEKLDELADNLSDAESTVQYVKDEILTLVSDLDPNDKEKNYEVS